MASGRKKHGKRTEKSRCFLETIGISGLKRQAPPNRAAKRLWKKGGNHTENVRQDDGKSTEKSAISPEKFGLLNQMPALCRKALQ